MSVSDSLFVKLATESCRRHKLRLAAVLLLVLTTATVQAQTSYPMLMSIRPVAAQCGQTSEHTINSRYDLYGAYQIIVAGEGVVGEPVLPEVKEGEKPPTLTKLKVNFTVAPDAQPGVREIRVATPRGVSTIGQLVIVRDPVVIEDPKNDSADLAQQFVVPATVCGCFEKGEDVDFYRFNAKAGQSLVFHVRSMRLQDRIHDLQAHSDPILTLRTGTGSTLATSDNYFYGDPCLAWTFEADGDYLLEMRDVRYKGNVYWEYSIEVIDRPFVQTVHPLAVPRGEQTQVELVGFNLPDNSTARVNLAPDAATDIGPLLLPTDDDVTNPVPVVVSDLPVVVEDVATANNSAESAQPVPIPSVIAGRIESESDIDCFAFEAKKGQAYSVEVIARRKQSALDSNLRILTAEGKRVTENDDMKTYKHTFADSLVENWTATADGIFVIEIRDLHLRGGAEFTYAVRLTEATPHFQLYLDTDKTQITPGTSGVFFVNILRKNGFTGGVDLHVDGLPEGVTASCGRILPDKGRDGAIILKAGPNAKPLATNIVVRGTASIDLADGTKQEISAIGIPYQETYQPGGGRGHWPVSTHTISVNEPSDVRSIKLSSYDLMLKPGESKTVEVEIERAEGFAKNVQLDPQFRHLNSVYASSLPVGVTVDTKTSKTLLTGTNTKGQITFTAADTAVPVDGQQVAVMANVSLNFVMKATYSSEPLMISVVKPE